jgi:hypothetical protein
MNELIASVLAAGELICEFQAGYKRSLIADLVREPRRVEFMLMYESVQPSQAQVISTRKPGRKPVRVYTTEKAVHLVEDVGASVMVTTLTSCTKWKYKHGEDVCVRFAAQHGWSFDTVSYDKEPDAALARRPSGVYTGTCEPWKLE